MPLLTDQKWKAKYTKEDGNLLRAFYLPALACAERYDRTTGYFTAGALALAARGIEGLVRQRGRMRLIVGCTLGPSEVDAIEQGERLREQVGLVLTGMPLMPMDTETESALELLSWMVAHGFLEVKVAVPCNAQRRPVAGLAIFHDKGGVLEDKTGDRLAFSGSINETAQAWQENWESFHVFTSWTGGKEHVDAEEVEFVKLWADQAIHARVVDLPVAVREGLLQFLPPDGTPPKRLEEPQEEPGVDPIPEGTLPVDLPEDPRKAVWSFIWGAPKLSGGGERIGEATAAVTPWPHQVRAFQRLWENWPPKLLIADEVGLGKTIQAGLLLRQAWLSGRAKRILVMAPASVLRQWQIELREKFNLNWPIYDGAKLSWNPSPGKFGETECKVSRQDWHKEPFVIVSSHLMRRRERVPELIEMAQPWDLIVVDEAHHARRKGGGANASDTRPNQLLRLMLSLRSRTEGLLLLTATPMQVSPLEVYDLLSLLGMPEAWSADGFLEFFATAGKPAPSHQEMAKMASLFRAVEKQFGETPEAEAIHIAPNQSPLKGRKLLRVLRDGAVTPLQQLSADERKAAIALMKANTPLRRLISRHTRELLRRYHAQGKLMTPIANRDVRDEFVTLSQGEARIYHEVEDYISSVYTGASPDRRTAVGFVMTIYRRRLASSFRALICTLEGRRTALEAPANQEVLLAAAETLRREENAPDDELDPHDEDAAEMENAALVAEERTEISRLLTDVKTLPLDSKTEKLRQVLTGMKADGYSQVMVFTQFTDTMDFLREALGGEMPGGLMCFSGRGGEWLQSDGSWKRVNRDETKGLFREGKAEVMLCTDAAAEGLNFQFCGALVNYDMPWNPMRVEQRIGRIDRLGQKHAVIRIVNLHYADTVETDVYMALRERIGLFQDYVGKLQPILSRLPSVIASHVLTGGAQGRSQIQQQFENDIEEARRSGFDMNDFLMDQSMEELQRPAPLYDLSHLQSLLKRPHLLPPGTEAPQKIGKRDFSYLAPGMKHPIRVTTDAGFYEENAESVELWSPGSPVFPAGLLDESPVDAPSFFSAIQ